MSSYFFRSALLVTSTLLLGRTARAHEGQGNTVTHALAHLSEQQSLMSIGFLIVVVIAIAVIAIRTINILNKRKD